ncbi:MAG: GNAT family N-acetyltransferase [Chloroflexi bacterium]|nr:GNAT family N-acetyltransferase [Chloroflexota bacterium]
MENMMEYKGYIAAVAYDDATQALYGTVVNARPAFSTVFEATDVKQLRKEFEISVDAYLSRCKEEKIEPTKPFYGKLQSSAAEIDTDIMDAQPIVLVGEHVRMEPIGQQHSMDLYEVGKDESIWRYLPRPAFKDLEDSRAWIESCIDRRERGLDIQFAVVHGAEERAIGSTGYLDIDRPNRALEIGMTWYGVDYQRTAVNTECKYLMLRHAFDDLGALRVCLKTDHRNERSQRAIERIGALRDGVLRNHRIAWDGANRHSVYYSIIDSEWPGVKARLEERLAA